MIMETMHRLEPWDIHNQRLQGEVAPTDWRNPKPAPRYHLVVLGGGTAGLVSAAIAAGLGARVALVERSFLGGDCLNTGCVPSKALIRSARAWVEVRDAHRFGIDVPDGARVDFGRVMERMRRLRADISPHDSARRFSELGVDVFFGHGRFVGTDCLKVGEETLRFSKAVIATGAAPVVPSVPGLETVPYLTHETLFSLTERPRRLGVLGAGPIGCEMAQCLARFGSQVTLWAGSGGVLPQEEREAAGVVRRALERDGVVVRDSHRKLQVTKSEGAIQLRMPDTAAAESGEVDQLLVAAGRAPRVQDLGLDAAEVAVDRKLGVRVDARLRTSNPRIFACGDVCSRHPFTHAADFTARLVVQNALFRGRGRVDSLIVPSCTYTSPELARVGIHSGTAEELGLSVDTFTQEFERVDRAVLDGATEGFVRVVVRKGTDRILGATVVGERAGELISELTLAMQGRLGLKALGNTLHPYPTHAEGVRRIGDLYSRTRLRPWMKPLLRFWFALGHR